MIDVSTLPDGELTALMAAANREWEARRTRAEIPRRLEAALTAADEAGITDVEALVAAARGKVAARGRVRTDPSNAVRGNR